MILPYRLISFSFTSLPFLHQTHSSHLWSKRQSSATCSIVGSTRPLPIQTGNPLGTSCENDNCAQIEYTIKLLNNDGDEITNVTTLLGNGSKVFTSNNYLAIDSALPWTVDFHQLGGLGSPPYGIQISYEKQSWTIPIDCQVTPGSATFETSFTCPFVCQNATGYI